MPTLRKIKRDKKTLPFDWDKAHEKTHIFTVHLGIPYS